MLGLTKQQALVLEIIETFIAKHRYSPSYEEIAIAMNLSSLATVSNHVKALEQRGYIRKGGKRERRSIVVLGM